MMPAISFSTLRDKIEDGSKKQTIRPYSDYWMRWRKGDRLVGYWKMRTKKCEKLFESEFIEDPFTLLGNEFTAELMIQDGFTSLGEAIDLWFKPHYYNFSIKRFVVIRWV